MSREVSSKKRQAIITITETEGSDRLDVKIVFRPSAEAHGECSRSVSLAMVAAKAIAEYCRGGGDSDE